MCQFNFVKSTLNSTLTMMDLYIEKSVCCTVMECIEWGSWSLGNITWTSNWCYYNIHVSCICLECYWNVWEHHLFLVFYLQMLGVYYTICWFTNLLLPPPREHWFLTTFPWKKESRLTLLYACNMSDLVMQLSLNYCRCPIMP